MAGPPGEVRNRAPVGLLRANTLSSSPSLWFACCSKTPGFSPFRKKMDSLGKGLPGVTQQAGDGGPWDPEACSPGAEQRGQGCLGDLLTLIPAVEEGPLTPPPPGTSPPPAPVIHPPTRQGFLGPSPSFLPRWRLHPAGWGPSHLLVIGFQGCSWLC